MKKLLQFLFILCVGTVFAQTDGLSYQAVILNPNVQEIPGADISGSILPNAPVALRFTITGDAGEEYQEVHNTTTDAYGMVNLVIGQGSANTGVFTEINWDGTRKDLQVEINLDGGYNTLSEQQLLFIPYAFHRDITATGDLTVDGATRFGGDLVVEGTTTLNDMLSVTNGSATDLTGTLNVEGETQLNGAVSVTNQSPTDLSGNLTVDGVTQLNNTLTVEGATQIANSLTVTEQNPTLLTGTLTVDGETNLESIVNVNNGSSVSITGDLNIDGATVIDNDLTVNGITTLNNDFFVRNESPSLLTGILQVEGETFLNNTLRVLGEANFEEDFNVLGQSPSYLSGTLVVDGETNLNNSLTVNNGSPTILTGSLEVQGDTTFTGNLEVDGTTTLNDALTVTNASPTVLTGTLDVDQATGLHDTLTVDGATTLNSTLEVANASASNLTGALTVDGATTLNNTLEVTNGSTTNLTGALNVDLATDLNDTLNVDGATTLNNTLEVTNGSTTNLTGVLNVDLGTDLNSTLNVDGATMLNSTLDVTNGSATNLTGTLNVDGATDLNNTLTVDGATLINNDLTVTGATNLGSISTSSLNVSSDNANYVATLTNTNAANGDGLLIKLGRTHGAWNSGSYLNLPNPGPIVLEGPLNTVKGWLDGGNFSPTQLLGLVPASFLAGGLASITNELITTINDGIPDIGIPEIAVPRIPIVDPKITVFGGLSMPSPIPDIPSIKIGPWVIQRTVLFNGISNIVPDIPLIPTGGLPMLEIPNFSFSVVNNSLSSENEYITFQDKDGRKTGTIRAQSTQDFRDNTILDNVYVINVASSFVGIDLLDGVVSGVVEISNLIDDFNKLGVEYSSGRGDYAEWLERVDADEYITAGDIVAIKGGKISRDLTGVEQIMVVSYKPIILGNAPEEGQTHLGNNVAFMGQVPVKVMGAVHTGDYIVAHPSLIGYGQAIAPKDMTPDDFTLTVGRSWENKPSEGVKMVNTVVGVHNGDWAKIMTKMEEKHKALEVRVENLNKIADDLLSGSND
jgi:hypothetical protein